MLLRKLMTARHLAVAVLLLVFLLQSFSAIRSKSATFDEVQYFGIGKYLLIDHKWDIMGAILHPPLSYYVNSIPLLFVQEDRSIWSYADKKKDLEFLGAIDYYRGQELLSASFNRGDRILIASRCMTLILALMAGVYIYRFSALLFGPNGGLISLFGFAFCPNMLAFSGLCVPDMPLTVFMLIAVYYLWRALNEGGKLLPLCAGISLGLALLTKFPALLLLPMFLALTVFIMWKVQKNLLLRLTAIYLLAFAVMVIGYQGDLTPFIQGNQYRLMQQEYGQSVYLLGQYSTHGWWYFYPLTFLMKTPLPVLILLPVSIYILYRAKERFGNILIFLLAPVVLFMFVFILSGYSVALRYLLPIYPFVFILIGSLSMVLQKYRFWLATAAVCYVASTLHVAPHYLAYFNEAFGGPGNGYRFLADSNLDWGQDLKGLKKYMQDNKIAKVSLSYFGADTPKRYDINYDWLPSHYLYNPAPEKPYEIRRDQLVAVSITNLLGVYLEERDMYRRLLQYEPVAKIGYSIYLYDLKGIDR